MQMHGRARPRSPSFVATRHQLATFVAERCRAVSARTSRPRRAREVEEKTDARCMVADNASARGAPNDFAAHLTTDLGEGLGCLVGCGVCTAECAESRSGRRGRYAKNVERMEKVSDEQYRR